MMEVTEAEFFAKLGRLNVHPRAEKDHSAWEIVTSHELIGRSEPGYIGCDKSGRYTTDKKYFVADRLCTAGNK